MNRTLRAAALAVTLLLGAAAGAVAEPRASATDRTAAYLDHVRTQRPLLMHFLERMPKGGDLHHHLTGAVYAESYIRYAVEDGDCIDGGSYTIVAPPCDPAAGRFPATRALTDFVFRNQTIDALSVRDFTPSPGDSDIRLHFFAAFDKFDLVTNGHWGEMFAEVVARAAEQNEIYLETMLTPDQGEVLKLAQTVQWTDDLPALRAGCTLTLRFQYQVLRAFPKTSVFAQMLAGFEMARADPRVVAINLVESQDEYNALHDFGLQMQMLDYLHRIYPEVHSSLHAGELTPVYERDPPGLLAEMRRRHILVEDSLYSHELVRGMRGRDNVLPIYLAAGVPVALATDDEGVTRADLTTSFQRAIEGYGVGYRRLKTIVRDSLDHAFLPAASLWRAPEQFTIVAACAHDAPSDIPSSASCRRYLNASERARLEWREEVAFARFERNF